MTHPFKSIIEHSYINYKINNKINIIMIIFFVLWLSIEVSIKLFINSILIYFNVAVVNL